MKNITNKATAESLINRVKALNADSIPLWGKMTAYQMVKHLAMWEDMAMGKTLYKQSFIGRLFGKMALKDMMKDTPIKPNLPTVPGFKITGEGDLEAEKKFLCDLISLHTGYADQGFLHPFFGELTAEQAGQMAYKHADHHLRQFGV